MVINQRQYRDIVEYARAFDRTDVSEPLEPLAQAFRSYQLIRITNPELCQSIHRLCRLDGPDNSILSLLAKDYDDAQISGRN